MASLYNKFLDFIGIEESDEIEDEREDYYEDRRERDNVVTFNNRSGASSRDRRHERSAASTGSNLPISGGMKMIVYHPVSYEDTQAIIDNLKNRKPVIVNMEELEVDIAQRILDFLSGAVYALNGTMCKISRGIFVVAPNNYDVVGNGEDDYDDMV
ncbi:MAG: cell division protein SepF [Clostridia bacterium]|nr:cell division protein SepF [Clostridia bacterium]